MLAGRVQCPCAPTGPRTFLQRVSGPLGAAPNAISTPRSAGSPGGRQVWRLLTAAPGSPGPQHQQRVACKAGPRLGHLPTGRGRGLRGSGRSDSGARISGSGGLCRGARGSASSGVGGGRGRGGRGKDRYAEEERSEAAGTAGCAPAGSPSPDLPRVAAAGMLEASPRCLQRHPRSGHRPRSGRKAGSCGGATPARCPPLAPPDPGRALRSSAAAGARELGGPA